MIFYGLDNAPNDLLVLIRFIPKDKKVCSRFQVD